MAALLARGRGCKLARSVPRILELKVPVSRRVVLPHEYAVCHYASSGLFKFLKKKQPEEAAENVRHQVIPLYDGDETTQERFIPITRRSIVRHLMQESDFLTQDELRKFETFALALDTAVVNRHHALLQELKSLFDPINPDEDTISTRQWNRRERLDNEFWLLQKMAAVLEKANFRELPREVVEKALAEHSSREGVMVSVNPEKYDVMRYWALGREVEEFRVSLFRRLYNAITRNPPPLPFEYYKRVVVAVRLKRDDKLLLKNFKEVPVNALEQLLPDGKVKMTKMDKTVLYTSGGLASLGVLAKVVTWMAHVQVTWALILTGVTGLTGVQAWTSYKNKHNSYMADLNRMLYFKNVANNRGLLTLLVDRAEDEVFKEALLTYSFLLTNRPPSQREGGSSDTLPAELSGMPESALEKAVEDWVWRKTSSRIRFESQEAVKLLEELGLLSLDVDGQFRVLGVDAAIRNLPPSQQSFAARIEETDIAEGYEKEAFEETEVEYKEEEQKRRKYGWF